MSGTRRTEEFSVIKTRNLTLQNPDGSFPDQGLVLTVSDGHGFIQPNNDITLNSITAGSITVANGIIQSDIMAYDISSNDIQTDTMTVTSLATTPALIANNIIAERIFTQDISCHCVSSTAIRTPVFSAPEFIAGDVSTNTLGVSLLSVGTIISDTANINTATTTDLRAKTFHVENVGTAYDISVNRGTLEYFESVSATIAQLTSNDIKSVNMGATSLNVTNNIAVNNMTVQGTFTYDTLTLSSLTTQTVQTSDVSTNTIKVTSASISNLTANVMDVSQINIDSVFSLQDLQSTTVIVSDTSSGTVAAGTINSSGTTNISTAILSGQLTTPLLSTPNLNVTNTYTTSQFRIGSTINLTGGSLTYIPTSGLLVNNAPISSTQALYPVPFSPANIVNGLKTISDISSSLTGLVSKLNGFMNIFSSRGLVVILTPEYIFTSNQSMQFIINGVRRGVLFSAGTYALSDIITSINAVSSPGIVFSTVYAADPDNPGQYIWNVKYIATGNNTFIADSSGGGTVISTALPTGSLQMLRFLGYNIANDTVNPYETYDLSGNGLYYTNIYNLSGSLISPNTIPFTVTIPNTLPTPALTYNTSDPYSVSFTLTNATLQAKYLSVYMSSNGYYLMYPVITTQQTITNLTPNTSYYPQISYLDNYNISIPNTATVTTSTIPSPQVSYTVTFNTIALTWSQPYPGKSYIFYLDASGQYITPSAQTSNTAYTYFPLLRSSRYVINVRSYDPSYNTYSAPTIIDVSTNPLVTPTPSIFPKSNSNNTLTVRWGVVPTGARGSLTYSYGSSKTYVYNISGSETSLDVSGLANADIFTASLVYTDLYYNTVVGSPATYAFNSSFGFNDISANAAKPLILDYDETFGIGYTVPAGSPWIGYTFNKMIFSRGITEITGNSVSIVANAYNVSTASLTGMYSSPPWRTSQLTLPPVEVSSTVLNISGGTTVYPTISFDISNVVFLRNTAVTTIVLVQIKSGAGQIRFSTFANGLPNPDVSTLATSLTYDRTGALSNGFLTSLYGANCQFDYVISLQAPTYTQVLTPYSLTFNLTNLVPSQIDNVASDISGVYTTYPNTQQQIVINRLTPNTAYATTIYYLSTFYQSSTAATISTAPIPPPVGLTASYVSINKITLSWSSLYPAVNYTYRLDASGSNITSLVTTSNTTYTYQSLLQGTEYTVYVTTFDPSFNQYSTPSKIVVRTLNLIVPTLSITSNANSNISVKFSWTPSPPTGTVGTLYYRFTTDGNTQRTYTIPDGGTSFIYDVSNTPYTGDISGLLIYTDGGSNTVKSSQVQYRYDPSFGFSNRTANAPQQSYIDNTTVYGLGYTFPAGSPWIGNTVTSVMFNSQIKELNGYNVSLIANVYNIQDLSGLYSPPYTVNFPTTTAISTSYIFFLNSRASANPVLTFTTPVTITTSTVILFTILVGIGGIQFGTFADISTNPAGPFATSLTYNGTTLANSFKKNNSGIVCFFNIILPPPQIPIPGCYISQASPTSLIYTFSNYNYNLTSYVAINNGGYQLLNSYGSTVYAGNLSPGTTYDSNAYYSDTNRYTGIGPYIMYASSSITIFPPPMTETIPSSTAITTSGITFSAATISWTPPTTPYVTYRYILDASGLDIPANLNISVPSYTYTNLRQSSPYTISVKTYDTRYPRFTSIPLIVSFSTLALTVPTPTFFSAAPPILATRIDLNGTVPSGISGELRYTVGGNSYIYNIPDGLSSYDISNVFYSTVLTASTRYTDNVLNTVTSPTTIFNYSPVNVWPSFQQNNFATSKSSYWSRTTAPSSIKWQINTASPVYGTPVIGKNGVIYFISQSPGILYAANALTGTLRWQYSIGYVFISSSPALGSTGNIYFGTQTPFNALFAVNSSGSNIWRYPTGGAIIGPITVDVSSETVYFGSVDTYLYAVNGNTGLLKWRSSCGAPVAAPVTIGPDGTIFVGTYGGLLRAFNPNGTSKWSSNVIPPATGFGYVYGSAPVINGSSYVTIAGFNTMINKGVLTSFNYNSGSIFWSKQYDKAVRSPVYDPSRNVYYFTIDPQYISAIDQSGYSPWTISAPGGAITSASLSMDASYNLYGTNTSYIYGLNRYYASSLWSYNISSIFSAATPVIGVDGTIYVATTDNRFIAL